MVAAANLDPRPLEPRIIARLNGLRRFGVRVGLDRIGAAMKALGNPQRAFPCVHLAGTNGKGSTAAMIDAVLRVAGYRTGLYTSPHLERLNERACIAGQPVDTAVLEAALDQVFELNLELTFFETLTAAAFLCFASSQVEIAIIETGLGGRLDATNIVEPELSLITPIGFDHTQVLGTSLRTIAREKAGIIKSAVPVVVANGEPEVTQVLQEAAAANGAPFWLEQRDFLCFDRSVSESDGVYFSGLSPNGDGALGPFELGLAGAHQQRNASLALAALELLTRRGFKTTTSQRREGLRGVYWPGRMERRGLYLLDCAHNPAGVEALASACRQECPWSLVFGASSTEGLPQMLDTLHTLADRVMMTRASSSDRSVSTDTLQSLWPTAGRASSVAEALAWGAATERPCLVTGSVYLVGEARRILRHLEQGLPVPTAALDPNTPQTAAVSR